MVPRSPPPPDREQEARRETQHVVKRDDQKRFRGSSSPNTRLDVEPPHGECGCNTYDDNEAAVNNAHQSELSMQPHITTTDQSRLGDEQSNPTKEHDGVYVKKQGSRYCRVKQSRIYILPEAISNQAGYEQRHQKEERSADGLPPVAQEGRRIWARGADAHGR